MTHGIVISFFLIKLWIGAVLAGLEHKAQLDKNHTHLRTKGKGTCVIHVFFFISWVHEDIRRYQLCMFKEFEWLCYLTWCLLSDSWFTDSTDAISEKFILGTRLCGAKDQTAHSTTDTTTYITFKSSSEYSSSHLQTTVWEAIPCVSGFTLLLRHKINDVIRNAGLVRVN